MSTKKIIPAFLPKTLADDILKKRTKEDLSIRGASTASGLNKDTLWNMEVGESSPSLDHYYKICVWLDKPLDSYFVKPKNVQHVKAGNIGSKNKR